MIKELKLSDEQVTKLKDIQTEARKGLVAVFEAKEGKSEKLKKLREETRTKILAVLMSDQKKQVREKGKGRGKKSKAEPTPAGPEDKNAGDSAGRPNTSRPHR